ncbi:MAG: DMT family transporter [Rhodobacteraceae bacterium]|nr:DMT family transporter [Paracoccaceae bacterium]
MTLKLEQDLVGRQANGRGGNAACIAAVFLFALGFPAADVLLGTWGPISLTAARISLAMVLILPLWLVLEGWQPVRDAPWGRGIWIGAVGFGVGSVMLLVSQWMADAVTAALVVTAMPVAAVALEMAFDGRRLTPYFLCGVALVLIGGVIATGANLMEGNFGIGACLGLVATSIFAWGSRATVKAFPHMTALGRSTITFGGVTLFSLLTWGVFLAMGWPGTASAPLGIQGWGLLLLFAWVAMAISQAFWISGVAKVGVAVASFHLNAVPFYVMVLMLALGNDWRWQQAIGAAILAFGVVLAQRRGQPEKHYAPAE